MATCGGAFGSGPFGSVPVGSGASLGVASAEQVARNQIRVTFFGSPQVSNPQAVFDALYAPGWTVLRLTEPASTLPLVVTVARVSATRVDVFVDDDLSGPGVGYIIEASPLLEEVGGGTIDPTCLRANFVTFGEAQPVVQRVTDRTFDLANPQTGRDAPGPNSPLATLQVTPEGDFAVDGGDRDLRKRVIRRLTTQLGAFNHLPNYGINLRLKTLTPPSRLRVIQADAESQLRQEPGVTDVRVEVSERIPGIVVLAARVQSDTTELGEPVVVQLPVL